MAAADKTYVNWEEYKQIKNFFTKEMKQKQRKDLGFYFGYADWNKKDFGDRDLPVWNTPTLVDLWLAQNCKLDVVQNRLREQYPKNWVGWRNLDFSEKGFLISAKYKDSWVSPFKKVDETTIETYDEVLVYGTTFVEKFFYNIESVIRKECYNVSFEDSFEFEIDYELFGLFITAKSVLGSTKYFVNDEEVYVGYFPKFDIGKDNFSKFFKLPKIKRSNKVKDFIKYEPEQIIMSHEDTCFNVDAYKEFDKERYKRYFHLLPNFIKTHLVW